MSERIDGFNVHLEADYWLSLAEIWPDGDAPNEPTADDVKAAMEKCGPKQRVLDDWMLLDDLDVDVNGVKVWR